MSTLKNVVRDIYHGTRKFIRGELERKVPVYIPKLQGKLLEGRTALITGGTSGIGLAMAEAFLHNGAVVFITGRRQERIDVACASLKDKCKADGSASVNIFGLAMDNSHVETFPSCFDKIIEELEGRKLDILVNNAGIIKGGTFSAVTESDFDLTLTTNLKGTYFLSQLVSEYMKREKIQGNILNVASSSSLRPAISPYTLSKWGIRGLTMGLAKTLIPYGIVVNGIAPGPTATPLLLGEDTGHLEHEATPNGRYAAPEEIANMAVVLTSSLGRSIIGDIVYMTCGSGVITVDDVKY